MTKPLLIVLFLCLSACDSTEQTATSQEPQMLIPEDAKDYYSHMGVLENSGEKGQVLLLDGQRETLWFGSVKNLLTYLHHPETANRPMQAYVSLPQEMDTQMEKHQWHNAQTAWYLCIPAEHRTPEAQAWQAYSNQEKATQAAQQEQGVVYAYQAISLAQLTESDSCLPNY